MPLPRPVSVLRRTFPAVLLTLLITGVGGGAEIRSGDLIITDRTADPFGFGDRRGTLFLVDPEAQFVRVNLIASPGGFVDPVATIPLSDGRILCLDQNARVMGDATGRGAIWMVDPLLQLPGRADLFAWSADWINPIDFIQESNGNLLVLDKDADPLGTGSKSGALFRVDFVTQQVTALAATGSWVEPVSLAFDNDGSVLVWDRDADPNNFGTSPGALFRVDPVSGAVDVVFSVDQFESPVAIGLDPSGDFLLVDRDANPEGYPGNPGGLFRITRPPDLTIEPLLFLEEFVAPVDFLLDPSGDIWILDQRANPANFPQPVGALFRCDPESGEVVRTISSGFFADLSSLSRFTGTALDSSVVTWEDLNGPPIQSGDRLRIRVRARNTGAVAGRPVEMEHLLGNYWTYRIASDSVSYGTYGYDPDSRVIRWAGDIEPHGEASISYEVRLGDGIPEGAILQERIDLSVGRTGSSFYLDGVAEYRSAPGRVVWADYATSEGSNHGLILEKLDGTIAPSVLYSGAPLVQPDDLVILEDGRIAILDRRSRPLGPDQPPGGIYRLDPLDGTLDTLLVIADYPELRFPVGLARGEVGEVLLVDKDANPFGHPGLPGALYSIDLESGSLDLICSVPEFSEPADAILETSGSILVVDYDADPLGNNPRGGAVFVVDRQTGEAEPIDVPAGTFVDPIGIAEGADDRVYVADLSADPAGIGRNTGAIFEINRRFGDLVLLASADSFYTDPTDVFAADDGWLYVADREGNPFDLPPRDRGAVYRVRPRTGSPSIVAAHPTMYGPEALAGVHRGDVGESRLDVTDLNGPPTSGGDTLRFETSIVNTGLASIPEAMATVQISDNLTLLGFDGPEEVVTDASGRIVSWFGRISAVDTIRIVVEGQLSEDLLFGDRAFGLMEVSAPGAVDPDSAVVSVVAPLRPGDFVLVDADADPNHLGASDGGLFLIRAAGKKAEHVLQTDTLWHNPRSIEALDTGRFLIGDSRGSVSGAILAANYLLNETESYVEDERLGSPIDLLWTRQGDLLVVDPSARLDATGLLTPVVFVQRGGVGGLEILCADSVLVSPSQIAEDDAGRLWLIDRRADLNGTEPGRGALFEIDPVSGAVLDTIQSSDLLSPTGIVNWIDEGLLITDELSSVSGSYNGALFLFDPESRSLQTKLVDSRFRQPRASSFAPSGEVWIVDRLARDETLPGSPRTLFEWDPETGRVDMVAASEGYASPMEVIALPGPNPRLTRYEIEDHNGPPLEPSDQVTFHVLVENIGPIETRTAVFRDTLPAQVRLDETSVRADEGIIEFLDPGNGLAWRVDLPPNRSYELRYEAQVHPGTYQGSQLKFRAHLRTVEGVHRVRRHEARVPVYFEDNYIYIADEDADPFELGGNPGAVWKVFVQNGAANAFASGPELVSPVNLLSVPTIEPTVLIIDSQANPRGYLRGRGSVWRWVQDTGGVSLVAADSTFRNPCAAVALNDHEILMLDSQADPWDLRIGLGPGAIYRIDIETGEVEPFISDTLTTSPVDLILDGKGGGFLVDPDADPYHFGLRNGAVFRFDLAERKVSIYAASADFRGPVSGALSPRGDLYVLDRDVRIYEGSIARGAVYRVDEMGNVTYEVSSQSFRTPFGIGFDPIGRILVSDRDADPRSQGTQTGAIFRRLQNETQFRVLSAYTGFADPSGFFVSGQATAIGVTGLQATPSAEGILIEWEAGGVSFSGFYCMRGDGLEPNAEEYRFLNDEPISGAAPWSYLDRDVVSGETYSYQIGAILPDGTLQVYGPIAATAAQMHRFALHLPSPNPVIDSAKLRFDLPAPGRVSLRLYDLTGRRVRSIVDGLLQAGPHLYEWDGKNDKGHPVACGLYLLRLSWGERSATKRMVLLR